MSYQENREMPAEQTGNPIPYGHPSQFAPATPPSLSSPPPSPYWQAQPPSTPPGQPNPVASQLGVPIQNYAGSPLRFAWPVLVGALAAYGIIASIAQGSLAVIIIWGGVGLISYGWFSQKGHVSAVIYEHGFSITKGSTVTSAFWGDIVNIEHWIRQTRLYFVIPISSSHSFTITLANGKKVTVNGDFQNEMQLGTIIQRMRASALAQRQAMP